MIQFKPLEWQEINLPGIFLCLMGIVSLPFNRDSFSGYMIIVNYLPGLPKSQIYHVSKLDHRNEDHGYNPIGECIQLDEAKQIAQEDWENAITSHFFELPFERITNPL